jgi:hypothetical protein
MPAPDEFWIPLVDEPIGRIVDGVQQGNGEITALVESPRRLLAFRTFAYIRVGVLLGRLLVDSDIDEPSERWVEQLLEDPAHRARVEEEVRAVAEEIAADPRYSGGEPIGPDDETRARFREFARRSLGPA